MTKVFPVVSLRIDYAGEVASVREFAMDGVNNVVASYEGLRTEEPGQQEW